MHKDKLKLFTFLFFEIDLQPHNLPLRKDPWNTFLLPLPKNRACERGTTVHISLEYYYLDLRKIRLPLLTHGCISLTIPGLAY